MRVSMTSGAIGYPSRARIVGFAAVGLGSEMVLDTLGDVFDRPHVVCFDDTCAVMIHSTVIQRCCPP